MNDAESAPPENGQSDETREENQKKEKNKENGQNAAAPAKSPGGFADFVAAWCRQQGLSMPKLHRDMARWLGKKWRAKAARRRLLLLAFRGAGKSTLVGLFAAWLLWKRPDSRILTLSADLALARKMVRNVKRLIESHPSMAGLKPKNPELWGGEQFTIARRAELRDPSMLARGIDGNFTGSRADVVICDDVEVPGNSDTPAKRAALREKLREVDFVLVPDGTQLYLGTPHTYYSIYAEDVRPETGEERPFLDGFERKAFPIYAAPGVSAWARRFTPAAIEAVRRAGPLKFASQMMLQPVAPAQCRFDAAKLIRYDGEIEYRESQGRASLWLEGRKLASIRVWWDTSFGRPQKSDRNAIAAVYQDEAGGYWLHRVHYFAHDPALAAKYPAEHAEAEQLCRAAAQFAHALGAPSITVEDNGIGKMMPGLLRKALAAIDPSIGVVAQHNSRPKDERILAAFDLTLAAGLLHAHAGVCDGPFAEELRSWQPLAKSSQADDGLDAVAGAILAEPVRLGPFPRAPGAHGAWRNAGQVHRAQTAFDP